MTNKPMTAGELIEKLKEFDPNIQIRKWQERRGLDFSGFYAPIGILEKVTFEEWRANQDVPDDELDNELSELGLTREDFP